MVSTYLTNNTTQTTIIHGMTNFVTGLFFLLVVSLFNSVDAFSQKLMQEAARAYKSKDYERAVELYSTAIDKGTVKGNPFLWRGMSHFFLGNAEEATEDLKKYIEVDPNNADVYNTLGLIYYESGNNTEAKYYFDQAINADPNFGQAYINRGMAWIGLTTPTMAAKDYDKAIAIDKRNPYAYYSRAELHYEQERYREAKTDVNTALNYGLHNDDVYFLLGNIYYKESDFANAIKNYSIALEHNPNNTDVLNNRAISYDRIGKTSQGEIDRKKLEQIAGLEIIPIEQLNFKTVTNAKDVMTFEIPSGWQTSTSRDDKGEIVIHAVPSRYKENPEASPVGIKFIYYHNLKEQFGDKTPLEIVDEFEKETKFQGMNMYFYNIIQRKYKRYGGTEFASYSIKSQARPSDRASRLDKSIANLNNTILIGYMYSFETQYPYFKEIFDKSMNTISFSTNKYLNN